ncbi:ANTAR domain-containing protein [Streptomyces sp. NPDC086783]|uniref:ANTAR domain-containing protein n=1 Tax=Streptomyces sp. NPDC086783 TaxID=3365758 RepID=UPI0037F95B98
MTTSREQWPRTDGTFETAITRLESRNAQLQQAVDSHAVVDQVIGVLIAVYGLEPAAGFEVLREVSPRTNTKLHAIAATLIG